MWQHIVKIPLFGTTITIHSYGALIVVAFLVGVFWTRRAAKRALGADPERTFNAGMALLFLGLAGARLVFAFADYANFVATPLSFLKIWEGGLVGYGGVVAGLLFLAWYLPKRTDVDPFALFDFLARGAALAYGFGWLASLMAGDDFGKATQSFAGIPVSAFQDDSPVVSWYHRAGADLTSLRIHPTQVYGLLFGAALFGVLAVFARRKPPTGRTAALFLMLHSVGTALLEVFRAEGEKRGMLVPGALSWGQVLAIPVFFAGVAIWMIRKPSARPAAA